MEIGARARPFVRAGETLLKEQPLPLGVAGFVLGVLIGVASRRTSGRTPDETQRAADTKPGTSSTTSVPETAVAPVSGGAPVARARSEDPVAGAIAGTLATAPMTVVMTSLRRQLPGARHQAIPPRQITRAIAARAGIAHALDAEQISAATYGAHLGYGGALGSVYPAFASRLGGPPPLRGALFGLLVWGVSYLGWLPATGILRSATNEPAGRNAMMISAHLVWGAATALLYEAIATRSSR